ncbi:hypothetical protein Tco_0393232 [Tanacetum coccineum]
MVNSQLEGEGAPGARLEGTGVRPQEGPTELAQLTQTTPSSAFIKENIDVLRTMIREHDQQAKEKATPKKIAYDNSEEENSDNSRAKGLLDRPSHESSGWKAEADLKQNPEEKEPDLGEKIRMKGGSKDSEDHLGNFLDAAEQEE